MSASFLFAVLSWTGLAAVMVRAFLAHGPRIAMALGFVFGVGLSSAVVLFDALGPLAWALFALMPMSLLYGASVARARMRSRWFRLLVTLPGSAFAAGSWLAAPWALLTLLGFDVWAPWLPFALAAIGTWRSLRFSVEEHDLVLDGRPVDGLRPIRHGAARTSRPLRVVQITDPHLGPFMSVARLRAACERAIARDPDLILLTGDYLTYESNGMDEVLESALAPLAQLPGRVFAIRGNHDLEVPEQVAAAMQTVGIRLLIDEAEVVETAAGPVQILGIDHRWRDRREHIQQVCAAWPHLPDTLRLVLLHDPAGFEDIPPGEADLVLSGHTHGGQVGLLDLGLSWTVLRSFGIPDHGFWGRGRERLYVHRGTGHYGFPVRVGVPPEESLLRIHRPAAQGGAR
ncbi:MAG: metallophosphoesterase [Myxococcota bacterium]|nr:metallophosphoesterase [Myxococcota bacterium]